MQSIGIIELAALEIWQGKLVTLIVLDMKKLFMILIVQLV